VAECSERGATATEEEEEEEEETDWRYPISNHTIAFARLASLYHVCTFAPCCARDRNKDMYMYVVVVYRV
jgi:hypothetical protein